MKKPAAMILSHNPRVKVKPSTLEDVQYFYGFDDLPISLKALSFFLDDELSAIGGIQFRGGVFLVFSDIKSDIKVSKSTVYRCGLMVMKMCSKSKVPLYCIRNDKFATSKTFLEKLGWVYDRTTEEGELYKCPVSK